MQEYTVAIEDGIRVKHGAQARFTVKAGRKVLEDSLTSVETLSGAITRAGIMYNQGSMSGRVAWWNPATGEAVNRPKYTIRLRPQDILTGEEVCDCGKC